MDIRLLKLLSQNAKYTPAELSVLTGMTADEVSKQIKELEIAGLIRGYKTVIDWEKLDSVYVSAIIELKVTPQSGFGFEKVAEKVMKYSEVESVYLMSGGYDLCVTVKGRTFQEVAMFVVKELATIKGVNSTATHFILRRYKELDVVLVEEDIDERGAYSL